MNESFIKNIKVLKSAIAERKLVVFAGAGVSIDSGAPTWNDLIKELRKDINIPQSENDSLRIAQLYYNERQQKEFIDRIREILKHKKLRYNEIHQEIFNLNPEHIITTNFDDLFEQVIKSKAYPYSVIKKDVEFPYAQNTKLLVKIHGDLDEANLVIKEDDYLEYSLTHPLIESFIKGIFANKVVLFIGYSFSDLDLKIILQSVRKILVNDFQNAYLLSVDKEFHPSQRQYLRQKGITVVNYHDAGKTFDDDFINQYLYVGRNALNYSVPRRKTSLSETGSKLLQLLQFISFYNDYAESIITEDPLSQMVISLNRFKNIKSLPPRLLGNLFPFNSRKAFIHNYFQYTLGSNNEKINKFFFEEVDSSTLKLNDAFFHNNSIPLSRRSEFDSKLKELCIKLTNSSIYFFGRTKNKIELFESPNEFSEVIPLSVPYSHCSCLFCKYNEFDLKGFLKDLKEETITETSSLQGDMLVAYANYKAGNIGTSIHLFQEIGNKAWQLEEYIIYFICLHNSKILENLLNWNFENSSDEVHSHLLEKIGELDLDKLMFQVPKLNDDVYNLLKVIRDDEILISAERKINSAYEQVLSIYELYKKGGQSYGPYYPTQVIEEFIKVYSFYTFNYIVKDEYLEFLKIFEKGIETLLICYSIDKRYTGKLKQFDSWVIKFILLYGNDLKLDNIIKSYSVKEIKIQDGEISLLIEFLINLLKSFYTENKYFNRKVALSNEVLKQSTNLFFQQSLRNKVHNAFLIFSLFEIPGEYSRALVKEVINFLKVESILILSSEVYFVRFIKNIINYFSYDEVFELLTLGVEKEYFIRSNTFYEVITSAIMGKQETKKIEDENLIKQIVSSSSGKRESGYLHLWSICNKECREIIEASIKKMLNTNFNSYDYYTAIALRIIMPSEFYRQILEEISNSLSREFKLEGEWTFYSDLTLLNFLYMIYREGLLRNEIPYQLFEALPDYVKFYLRPFDFEYSKFKVDWLRPLKGKIFFNHLKDVKQLKNALEASLKYNYDTELSEIYTRYFL